MLREQLYLDIFGDGDAEEEDGEDLQGLEGKGVPGARHVRVPNIPALKGHSSQITKAESRIFILGSYWWRERQVKFFQLSSADLLLYNHRTLGGFYSVAYAANGVQQVPLEKC